MRSSRHASERCSPRHEKLQTCRDLRSLPFTLFPPIQLPMARNRRPPPNASPVQNSPSVVADGHQCLSRREGSDIHRPILRQHLHHLNGEGQRSQWSKLDTSGTRSQWGKLDTSGTSGASGTRSQWERLGYLWKLIDTHGHSIVNILRN